MPALALFIIFAICVDLVAMPPYETAPAMNYVREIIGLVFVLLVVGLIQLSDWLAERTHRRLRARR